MNKGFRYIRTLDEPAVEKMGARPEAAAAVADEENGAKTVTFVAREPIFRMANLVLPERTLEQLRTLRARFECHELVYGEWGLSATDPAGRHTAFNLYGPPGTGKTMCVEAIANELGRKIIDISYAEIESKYVGDTGKNIAAAFAAAREQGAILFFDEADSILGRRMTSVTQAADQAVNVARAVMLKQLDAFDGIVAFATNLARNFDSAFVRRIPIHIAIPLPDRDGRRRIAETLLPKAVPFRSEVDFDVLAAETEGFSGGDLKNVVVNSVCALASSAGRGWEPEAVNAVFREQVEWTRNAKREVGCGGVVVEEDVKGGVLDHVG